jgi:DNA adenine methylase
MANGKWQRARGFIGKGCVQRVGRITKWTVPQACVNSNGRLSPPLKWAGGKRWLAPQLLPIWQEHACRRLVEPFCGGLAVTLSLRPERAPLNDVNPHLIHFYGWLKRGLRIQLAMENDEELFYRHRDRFNELLRSGQAEAEETAGLFYFLNRTGFNGLCRFNRKGEFNVPFGSYRTIPYLRDFTPYQAGFETWEFTAGDFEKMPIAPGDFIYADPPYDVEFTQYSKEAFGWEEQVRTARWLARHPGPVVLSNQATERILALYRDCGFELRLVDAPRRISCTGDRSPAKEVLATRNLG